VAGGRASSWLKSIYGIETGMTETPRGAEQSAKQSATQTVQQSASSSREQRQPRGKDISVLRDAGSIRATDSGESQGEKGRRRWGVRILGMGRFRLLSRIRMQKKRF
jgi:hypothetical protein